MQLHSFFFELTWGSNDSQAALIIVELILIIVLMKWLYDYFDNTRDKSLNPGTLAGPDADREREGPEVEVPQKKIPKTFFMDKEGGWGTRKGPHGWGGRASHPKMDGNAR